MDNTGGDIKNLEQLTNAFANGGAYQLKNSLKGIGIQLGISTNMEATTAQYVDVRLDRIRVVLQAYHNEILPEKQLEAQKEQSRKKNEPVK